MRDLHNSGVVFSKLDEVDCKDSVYNLYKRFGKTIKYVNTGGNVTDDIERFGIEKYTK